MTQSNLNMLADAVFRVRRRSGAVGWASLADLMAETGDYPVAFAWPRADLDVASLELAIGLVAVLWQPAEAGDWRELWRLADPTAALAERIAELAPHFNLFGDAGAGPRFMQDFDPLESGEVPVAALFIDTPGASTASKNKDLLTHRDRYVALGLKAAAIALYALQQFAPTGGAGIRTSMRGGGPMTTLLLPGGAFSTLPLWRVILANVPTNERYFVDDADWSSVLPWLAPAHASEKGGTVSETAAHPLQAFFGMPRRIRLVLDENPGTCGLTGEPGPVVRGFIQRPHGVNYGVWLHPLTPYRRLKVDAEPYSVKPKAGRLSYRDWVGVAVSDTAGTEGLAFPAAVVGLASARYDELDTVGEGRGHRLLAAGWAMNNMEAEAYLFAEQPFYLVASASVADRLRQRAVEFHTAADRVARDLKGCLKLALFSPGAKPDTGKALFLVATEAFYADTEPAFHHHLASIAKGDGMPDEAMRRAWLSTLRRAALDHFNRLATAQLAVAADEKSAARIADGYGRLLRALAVTGAIGRDILQLPQPEKPAAKAKSRKENA